MTDDWSLFDANRPIARTSGLTLEEIEKFVDTFSIQPVRDMDLDTEIRYREGKLSQQEQLIYFGKKKLDIIFKLLSEDIVETTDPIPITSDIAPEIQYSEYITTRMDSHTEFILPSIRHLVERGYLKYKIDNNHLVWYWP